jgi:hypothetical protein
LELLLLKTPVFGVRKLAANKFACAFPREASFAQLKRQQAAALQILHPGVSISI